MLARLISWKKNRSLKGYREVIARINAAEPTYVALSDEDLQAEFKRVGAVVKSGGRLADSIAPIFAIVREAAKRTIKQRAYDVQLMGALVLVDGAIAEMGTGEGKTLMAPFAVAVHFLQGRQVHLCTANDYLAQRDATDMLDLYKFLGISVAARVSGVPIDVARQVYRFDVVYGTDQLFAQDYLHDNLMANGDVLQYKGHGALILDEADSALIDNARIPVAQTYQIPADENRYRLFAELAQSLDRGEDDKAECDFWLDGQNRQAVLTDAGYERATVRLIELGLMTKDVPLYSAEHQQVIQQVTAALGAWHLLHKDQDYVVADGQLVLIDSQTGRLIPGRRWDAGLHQAIEAKEGLEISPENVVMGRITLQNYFKLYSSVAGMTGTAVTEEEELLAVYGLRVVEIPPNKPSKRTDMEDKFFRTQASKLDAVVQDIVERHDRAQPVLVGTASVEQSEELSARLAALNLPHEVLNARQHSREAEIVALAGRTGAITVSTNMAGRGVDIVLGGRPSLELAHRMFGQEAWDAMSLDEKQKAVNSMKIDCDIDRQNVLNQGGLHIIGMERYESRRMDRQLRGRCGRQGDPGSTCFYISLEDPLVENFAGENIRNIFKTLDIKEGDDFEAALVHKTIDSAQRQVEGRSAAARKGLMTYDDVLDDQRRAFYDQRHRVLSEGGNMEWITACVTERVDELVNTYAHPHKVYEEWDLPALRKILKSMRIELPSDAELMDMDPDDLNGLMQDLFKARLNKAFEQVEPQFHENVARYLVRSAMDRLWFTHLEELDHLRRGIHLRAHAKEDPQRAYKREAFGLFDEMLDNLKVEVVVLALNWVLSGNASGAAAEEADGTEGAVLHNSANVASDIAIS